MPGGETGPSRREILGVAVQRGNEQIAAGMTGGAPVSQDAGSGGEKSRFRKVKEGVGKIGKDVWDSKTEMLIGAAGGLLANQATRYAIIGAGAAVGMEAAAVYAAGIGASAAGAAASKWYRESNIRYKEQVAETGVDERSKLAKALGVSYFSLAPERRAGMGAQILEASVASGLVAAMMPGLSEGIKSWTGGKVDVDSAAASLLGRLRERFVEGSITGLASGSVRGLVEAVPKLLKKEDLQVWETFKKSSKWAVMGALAGAVLGAAVESGRNYFDSSAKATPTPTEGTWKRPEYTTDADIVDIPMTPIVVPDPFSRFPSPVASPSPVPGGGSVEVKVTATPTATSTEVAAPPTLAPTLTNTATPTSTVTQVPFTPTPTETPTAVPATPTETVEPEAEPQIADSEKRDLSREFIIPRIAEIAHQRRKDRAILDPESVKRINPELNKNRINGAVLGIGKEGSLADSIMCWSYDIESHTLTFISFPRDLQAPEVMKKTGSAGSSRINQVLSVSGGGLNLARETLENATALSMDFISVGRFDAVVDIVDKMGGVEITIDKDISDPQYPAREGYGFDPFYLKKGTHKVDGPTALKIARSRQGGSSDYERADRQQLVAKAVLKAGWGKIKNAEGVSAQLDEANKLLDIAQGQIKNGNLRIDFDLEQFRPTLTNLIKQTPTLFPQIPWTSIPEIIKEQVTGKGWKMGSEPKMKSIGINPSMRTKNGSSMVVGAGVPGVAITKISGGNPNSQDTRRTYWGEVRDIVETKLNEKQ